MSRDTNLFQDAWTGWVSFVREIVGRPSRLKTTRPGGGDLKPIGKLPIKAPLKRDLTVIRRPQPKRAKSVTTRLEAPLLRREPAEDVPQLKVDPPKPFKLKEEFLETPPERVSRLEKEQKKKPLRKKVAAWLQAPPITRPRRHLLFLNVGPQKVR